MRCSRKPAAATLAAAAAVDHRLGQPRFAVERAAVMRPRGLDDLAAAAEDLVAELEDAQIGPSPRAQPDDFLQHLVGRPVGAGLRQEQDCRRGRARYSGMAMDEQMRLVGDAPRSREKASSSSTSQRSGAIQPGCGSITS